jgi:PAS domain-containing protein
LIRQDPDLRDIRVVVFSSLSAKDFRWFPEMSADAYVAKSGLPAAGENLLVALRETQSVSRSVAENGILGFRDMHARHVVRRLLEDRADLLAILASLHVGVLEVDSQGQVLRATPAACEALGRMECCLIGETLSRFCPADDRERLDETIAAVIEADKPSLLTASIGDYSNLVLEFSLMVGAEDRRSVLIVLLPVTPSRNRPTSAQHEGAAPTESLQAPQHIGQHT